MKKIILVFLFVLLIFPHAASGEEQILDFSVSLNINADASVKVEETIVYDFGADFRHGIYRDIPISYQRHGGNYNLKLEGVEVRDKRGAFLKYELSRQGKNLRIKIGDANVAVNGSQTYVVSYTVKKAINFFDNHDELYWNATGNEWPVNITRVLAEVTFPQSISQDRLQTVCFAGYFGSQTPCQGIGLSLSSPGQVVEVSFWNNDLPSGQDLSIVVGLPKKIIAQPSAWQVFLETLNDNWVLGIPFLVLILCVYAWLVRGRDQGDLRVVVPEYEVPENLTPVEAGTLVDEKADDVDISAELIHLAVKGYVKITRLEKKIFRLFDSVDYELELVKPKDGQLTRFQSRLLEGIFSDKLLDSSKGAKKKLSGLKNKFYKDLITLKEMAYNEVVLKGYFLKSPESVRKSSRHFGLILAVAAIFLGIYVGNLYLLLVAALSGVIIFIFSFFMPAKTFKGARVKAKVLGLKLYLSVAEKDRLKFHSAPEKNPAVFEHFLPYAMVLGVEEAWASQFEGIYKQPPKWYAGNPGTFSVRAFTHTLGDFSNSANTAFVSRPHSAGGADGGFSGFGGGGFSGGGFGGGGGGSW